MLLNFSNVDIYSKVDTLPLIGLTLVPNMLKFGLKLVLNNRRWWTEVGTTLTEDGTVVGTEQQPLLWTDVGTKQRRK